MFKEDGMKLVFCRFYFNLPHNLYKYILFVGRCPKIKISLILNYNFYQKFPTKFFFLYTEND